MPDVADRSRTPKPPADQPLAAADAALVLGKPVNPDGSLPPMVCSRLDEAQRLYRAGLVGAVVVSGGAVHSEHVEAEAMAAELVRRGIPVECVLAETRARNTMENGRLSEELMLGRGWRSAIVIASPSHLARARMLFEALHLDLQYDAVPLPPDFGVGNTIAHETLEFLLRTWTRIFGQTPIIVTKGLPRPRRR